MAALRRLGREPESSEVVAAHLGAKDEIQLAQVLMSSPEFTARRRQFFLRLVEISELAPLEVESEATPVEIAECLEKIKAAWSHLGSVSPHFSVLTDRKFLPDNLPKAIDDFWESGRLEAEQVLRTLERKARFCRPNPGLHDAAFVGSTDCGPISR